MTATDPTVDDLAQLCAALARDEACEIMKEIKPGDLTACEIVALLTILRPARERKRLAEGRRAPFSNWCDRASVDGVSCESLPFGPPPALPWWRADSILEGAQVAGREPESSLSIQLNPHKRKALILEAEQMALTKAAIAAGFAAVCVGLAATAHADTQDDRYLAALSAQGTPVIPPS